MVVLGLGAWAGGIAWLATDGSARWLIGLGWAGALATSVALQIRPWRADRPVVRSMLAALLVAGAVAGSAGARSHAWVTGPVGELGRQRAIGEVVVRLTSDPRLVRGRFDERVVVRARTVRVSGRGEVQTASVPVLVIADRHWLTLTLGATVHTAGRFGLPNDSDLAAVVTTRGDARVIRGPPTVFAAADRIREALRVSVAGRPADQAALVPALVVGDDTRVSESLAADFRTTGLTHLMAVSGTNLTLMVGFVLLVARRAGIRGRGLTAVAVLGILGFVLVARAEPSVLRAAVMGGVALIGLGGGRRRGTRALGVAMTVLLLAQPWLALSPGFALSVLATAGILLVAPAWRSALARWLPSPMADAVAVPLAAQLACTPVVAAISGEVSLVAVVANLVAAPAVAPATVLGFAGGLGGLVWPTLASWCGWAAGWCVAWIAVVARTGADLPTAAVAWPADAWGIGLLSGLSALIAVLGPTLVARRWVGMLVVVGLVLAVALRPPTPGWPPNGWVLAACDVGQGDALLLHVSPGAAVLVDAGPDPRALARCLDRFDIDTLPLVVLTHYHADHVAGLAAAAAQREVGAVLATGLAQPAAGAADVRRTLAAVQLQPVVPQVATTWSVGEATLQLVGPARTRPGAASSATSAHEEGSDANNASLVLLVALRGLRILLTGDAEPPAQAWLARALMGQRVDVLKVPHHGSRYQDLRFLTGLAPAVSLISVGVDNGYGHPSAEVMDALEAAGSQVLRTDRDGDLVVIVREGQLTTMTGS